MLQRSLQANGVVRLFNAVILSLWLAVSPVYAQSGGMLLKGVGGGSSSTPFSITYVGTNNNTTAAASFTYTAQGIGTADPTRIVAVAISGGINNIQVTGVTIGGSNATQATSTGAFAADNAGTTVNDIWYLAVPSGTTANIVVTYSGSQTRNAIAVFSVVGTGVAFSTSSAGNGGSSTETTCAATATVPAGGGAIVLFGNHTTTITGFTPTNWSVDLAYTAYGSNGIAAGHTTSASGSTAFTSTWTTNGTCATSVATFSP